MVHADPIRAERELERKHVIGRMHRLAKKTRLSDAGLPGQQDEARFPVTRLIELARDEIQLSPSTGKWAARLIGIDQLGHIGLA
jgi:hypothetical protein